MTLGFLVAAMLLLLANAFFVAVFWNILSLVAKTAGHFLPETVSILFAFCHQFFIFFACGINQLHLTFAFGGFFVGHNPDIS